MADLLEAFLADMQELKPSDGLVGQATSTINDISNREDEDYSCEAFVVSQNQIKDTSLNLPKVDHSVIQYDPFKRRFWDNPARDMKSWDDAQFNARLMKSISVLGLESPTMIQRRAIPLVLQGVDVIAVASTGSGKTFAFLFPMIMHIMDQREIERGEGPIALVMCPTRELAGQIYSHMRRLFKPQGCLVCPLTGGTSRYEQQKSLKEGCEAVVGTPGRVIDMIKTKALDLKRITFAVLDEADKMLEIGFECQVHTILQNIRPDRQLVLFSATFQTNSKINNLISQHMRSPIKLSVADSSKRKVNQIPILLNTTDLRKDKEKWLVNFLRDVNNRVELKAIVFVGERVDVESLCCIVNEHVPTTLATSLHGAMHQQTRSESLRRFTNGESRVLVATDVAARGIDIARVDYVICFDRSRNVQTHIHKIGRAGRLGSDAGTAYSLIGHQERDFAKIVCDSMRDLNQSAPAELVDLIHAKPKPLIYGMFVKAGSVTPNSDTTSIISSVNPFSKEELNAMEFNKHQPAKKKSRWDLR